MMRQAVMNRPTRWRPMYWVAAFGLAGAMSFAVAGTTLAAPQAQEEDPAPEESEGRQGYFGTVAAVEGRTFSVDTRRGETVEFAVDEDTTFRAPRVDAPGFDDLEEGTRVAVLALHDGDELTALHVMMVPGQPQRQHRTLTVVEVDGDTVIAEDAQGNTVTVELPFTPPADIVGETITFVGERGANAARLRASAQVSVRQVMERLEGHAERMRERVSAARDSEARVNLERMLNAAEERIAANAERHLDRLAEVRDRVPEQTRERLASVLEEAERRYTERIGSLRERAEEIRERVSLRSVTGSVGTVDSEAGTISIQSAGRAEVTLTVTDETAITGAESLGRIVSGSRVTARFEGDSMEVVELRVSAPSESESGRP